MKIALKIVVVCLIAMMLITATSSYLIARREVERETELQQHDASQIADLVRESVELAYQKGGQQGILQAMRTQTIETGMLRYRWVWFDVSVNDPCHPVAPIDSLDKVLAGDMDSIVSSSDGQNKLHTYSPLDLHDEKGHTRKGGFEFSGSLNTAEQEAWRTIKTGLAAIAAMAVFCIAFVSWAGVKIIGSPLKKLIEQTRKIGDGDYAPSSELKTLDEFGELSTALNSMAEKISQQQERIATDSAAKVATMEQLRHADRLKTVGRLAAGIAHEIGTPLNVVSGRAGLIRSGNLTTKETEESAEAIQTESIRIAGIVRQLLDFARHNLPKRTPVDLRVVVDRTVGFLKTLATKHNVSIEVTPLGDPPFTAFIDESQIQQVLTNLIVNAIQASQDGDHIDLTIKNSIRHEDEQSLEYVEVTICDHGIGMDGATLENVFEPFFTTKEVGQGTGLGLSIAHGIVQEHGGRMEVDSKPGGGTTFCVLLPKKKTDPQST